MYSKALKQQKNNEAYGLEIRRIVTFEATDRNITITLLDVVNCFVSFIFRLNAKYQMTNLELIILHTDCFICEGNFVY